MAKGRGFTLVELLVVIAIIGVLISLLLPAVQQAREAARRMQCSNNLKQIGLALHTYHDTHNALPPGSLADGDATWGEIPNWRAFLFPGLEQSALHDALDWRTPGRTFTTWYGSGPAATNNLTVLSKYVIDAYVCPSSPSPTNPPDGDVNYWNGYWRIQVPMYIGITGGATLNSSYVPEYPVGNPVGYLSGSGYGVPMNNGTLVWNQTIKMRDISDGLSNTMVIGEQSGLVGELDIRSGYGGGYTSTKFSNKVQVGGSSNEWGVGLTGVLYPPNSQTTTTYSSAAYKLNTVLNSTHPGGVECLMVDGSVQFLTDTIEMNALRSYCARNDGLVISKN